MRIYGWRGNWRETASICLTAIVGWFSFGCGAAQAAQAAPSAAPLIGYLLEEQDLGDALNGFALQSEVEILFDEKEIAGKRSKAVIGQYQPQQALSLLLEGQGIRFYVDRLGTFLVGNNHTNGGRSVMRMKKNSVRWFAAGVAAATAVATGAVSAEEADGGQEQVEAIEEVVVYGIRSSMQQSLDRKRNADHLVDALTAEDIGAFPDQNLAESLQRISGVAIDRKSGEGAFVSVRGLGPNFVQTTVHGRVSASNVAPGDFSGMGANNAKSRAVGYNQFQSGLVQAVEVNKSPRADHVEGGLGGFIDVQPRRPLDLGKRYAAFSADVTKNELADDTAPGLFAMYSDVLTDNLGFMVSAEWDNRVSRTDNFETNGYGLRTITVDGAEVTGWYPNHVNGRLHNIDRDRLNVSSSLQWKPSDRLDITLDLLLTNSDQAETEYLRGYRINQGTRNVTDATFVEDNGENSFTNISTSGAGLFLWNQEERSDIENMNVGLNLKFQATDKLAINVDMSLSETEAPIMLSGVLSRNTATQMTYDKFGAGKLPSMTSSSPVTDPNHYTLVWVTKAGHLIDDRLSQFRVDATYEFGGDWLQTIQFGARTYRQDRRDRSRYLGTTKWRGDAISDHGGGVLVHPADFLSGLGLSIPANTPAPNRAFTANELETITEADTHAWQNHTASSIANFPDWSTPFNEDLNHDDDGDAMYLMVEFAGEFGNTPYTGNMGVRAVDNSTGSRGEISAPIDIDYSDPSAPVIITSAPEYLTIGHEYSEVLPSLNLRFDPTDEIVIRFAAAKVLSRPRFLDLSPRQTVQANNRTTRGGNGTLDPTTAVQFDLALEWYFDDYSIASVGLFTKDIEGFVQQEQTPTPFPGVIDPDTNKPLELLAFRPLNSGDSGMTGIELAFQRTFADLLPAPWDGLGVIANYTYIDSDTDFENTVTGASYGIPGLSENTVNLTLFYEKGPLSGRVSYNFRDEFLDSSFDSSRNPVFVDAYEQWDISFGYTVNDNLSISLEGINLADENVFYYERLGKTSMKHYSDAANSGRRFQAGVRWKM